jgi:hypothetical protein
MRGPGERLGAACREPCSRCRRRCPEGARDGLPHPLDEGLAEKGGALITPVDGGLVAAAVGDGGDAGVLLERGGVREALAALAEGDEEALAFIVSCGREVS